MKTLFFSSSSPSCGRQAARTVCGWILGRFSTEKASADSDNVTAAKDESASNTGAAKGSANASRNSFLYSHWVINSNHLTPATPSEVTATSLSCRFLPPPLPVINVIFHPPLLQAVFASLACSVCSHDAPNCQHFLRILCLPDTLLRSGTSSWFLKKKKKKKWEPERSES